MLLKDLGYEIIFTNLQIFLGMWNAGMSSWLVFKMSRGTPPIREVMHKVRILREERCLCEMEFVYLLNVKKKTPLDATRLDLVKRIFKI